MLLARFALNAFQSWDFFFLRVSTKVVHFVKIVDNDGCALSNDFYISDCVSNLRKRLNAVERDRLESASKSNHEVKKHYWHFMNRVRN